MSEHGIQTQVVPRAQTFLQSNVEGRPVGGEFGVRLSGYPEISSRNASLIENYFDLTAQGSPPQTELLLSQMVRTLTQMVRVLGQLIGLIKATAGGSSFGAGAGAGANSDGEVNTDPVDETASEPEVATLSFKDKMKELLEPDALGSISEETMQYGVISYQLYQKSPALERAFQEAFELEKDEGLSTHGAAELALKRMGDEGFLTKKEVAWVYSLSHRAAQFDKRANRISTSSADDFKFDAALALTEANLVGINHGTIVVRDRSVDETGWVNLIPAPVLTSYELSESKD